MRDDDGFAVEVDGVVKSFGRLRALDGVRLRVAGGRCSDFSAPTDRARRR